MWIVASKEAHEDHPESQSSFISRRHPWNCPWFSKRFVFIEDSKRRHDECLFPTSLRYLNDL